MVPELDPYNALSYHRQMVIEGCEFAQRVRRIFEREHPDDVVIGDALATIHRWIGWAATEFELKAAKDALHEDYLRPPVFASLSIGAYATALCVSKIVEAALEPERVAYHVDRAVSYARQALQAEQDS
jgi:hypothetical protein